MADERLRAERSVGLFAVGLLALNFPILSLFEQEAALFGVPTLYLYLFVLWSLLIALSFVSMRPRKSDARSSEQT